MKWLLYKLNKFDLNQKSLNKNGLPLCSSHRITFQSVTALEVYFVNEITCQLCTLHQIYSWTNSSGEPDAMDPLELVSIGIVSPEHTEVQT